VFNIQGGELIFLLLIALVVLGPEKLPDAVRKFTKAYSEFKKMTSGFQGEMRSVLEEPMRELRDTADMMREAANIDIGLGKPGAAASPKPATPTPARPVSNLNFGNADARRSAPRDPSAAGSGESTPSATESTPSAPASTGMNFGDPSKRRRTDIDDLQSTDDPGAE
jgi:sec-independent protein translocase protein TatB